MTPNFLCLLDRGTLTDPSPPALMIKVSTKPIKYEALDLCKLYQRTI